MTGHPAHNHRCDAQPHQTTQETPPAENHRSISHQPQPDPLEADTVWQAHQADRAWIEWGFCRPPITIRRPRCVACAAAWPCESALAAHHVLTSLGQRLSTQSQPVLK